MQHNTGVEVTVWSFAVMVTSIIVDFNRSRMLYRAARKHNSQALEADALHFSTDIWSSSVVLVGLASVLISQRVPDLLWLRFSDSVAAILVAVICLYVIFQLGMRSIHVLLDAAPPGMDERNRRAAESVPGVSDCHNIRIRTAGPQVFIDVHVLLDGSQSLEKAHELTDVVERAIQAELPGSDVTVHPEPDETIEGHA
jgi:cation diffusion facilitator family transporter